MSMTPSRPGAVDGAGDAKALFLKLYGGEVLTAFAVNNVMKGRTRVRTIKNGKSAQFPATWQATAEYHTPGTLITGQTINSNERVLTVDDLLISPVSIAEIDEAMSHYDFRGPYSTECGRALARTYDKNLMQVGCLAARASATVSGGSGGTVLTDADAKTTAAAMIENFALAAQTFDEKNVPEDGRFAVLKPAEYHRLVGSGSPAIHTDYNPEGNGSIASGKVFRLHGIEIVKSNHLPSTNVTTGPTAYRGNFTNTAALFLTKEAIGTVELIGLQVSMAWLEQYQTTLVVAKMAVGHGILRPECAIELVTA